ncbi:serine hydrolase domain-containing protein [Aureibaculum conchae]|uniref:serine hydrolase domain-containing protein n=1 Tax=Aureibaculum sp. 2308TA14-22 TaxID=3108392 RepID=UPI0033941C26
MKKIKLVVTVIIAISLVAMSCDGNDISLEPKNTIECNPVGLGESHPYHKDYRKILDNYISKGFPGITAAIYTPENGLWVGASGLSDIKNRVAMNTCNTLFSGSVAKLYTVTAGMILYEQGKLDLDAKISNFLPQNVVDNLPNAKEATIRQLMNHTAGMPDHDDEEGLNDYIESNEGNLPSAEEQLAYLFDDDPLFVPGESVQYSSAHTLTLSLVIDSIAGEHHSNIISKEIIQKVGLTETFYKNETGYPSPKNLVNGYLNSASKNNDITKESINYCKGSHGDAGIIASANDYLLFIKALIEGEIVSQNTLDTMLTPVWGYNQSDYSIGFGLGFIMGSTKNILNKIGHSGATAGGMSHVYYYPTKKAFIVLLTNTLAEDDEKLIQDWSGNFVVGAGGNSIMEDLESIHF